MRHDLLDYKKVSVRRTNALYYIKGCFFTVVNQIKKAAHNQLEDVLKIVCFDIYVSNF